MIETKIHDFFAGIDSLPVDAHPANGVLRQVRRRRIRNGSGIILLSLALVCGAVAAPRILSDRAVTPVTSTGEAPTMKSVTPEQLAAACCPLGLLAPSTSNPPISKARAERIALERKQFPPGTTILESILARTPEIPNGWLAAGVDVEDFWIMSMWPPNGEFGRSTVGGPDSPAFTYGLVFIDARTGTWLSTARGS